MSRRLTKTDDMQEAERLAELRRNFRRRRIPRWEAEIIMAEESGDTGRAAKCRGWLQEDRRALEKISAADHLK